MLVAEALAEPERLVAHDPAYAKGAQRLGALLRTPRERLAARRHRRDALWALWTAPPGPTGCAAPRTAAGRPDATRTAIWTRCAPCSRPRPAPRNASAAGTSSTSWTSWRPRTSPPTPSPAARCGRTPSG
ncbi:hypothetical protein [Streptomyces thioluteus]|uniref:hypothetical protein n=1 Tax=Streptomyces thioluteus TaxID=66431 RepID=UPI0031E9E7CD